MTYIEKKQRVLDDQSTSYWLKKAVSALDQRDPVDALIDATTLNELCATRVEELPKLRQG